VKFIAPYLITAYQNTEATILHKLRQFLSIYSKVVRRQRRGSVTHRDAVTLATFWRHTDAYITRWRQ